MRPSNEWTRKNKGLLVSGLEQKRMMQLAIVIYLITIVSISLILGLTVVLAEEGLTHLYVPAAVAALIGFSGKRVSR